MCVWECACARACVFISMCVPVSGVRAIYRRKGFYSLQKDLPKPSLKYSALQGPTEKDSDLWTFPHTPMQPLRTWLISVASSSQFSQHFPRCSHVVGTVLGTVGTERWRPVFKGKLVPSTLTKEALKEELLRSCARNFARPSALSINPARSSDMKTHLWSPRWRGSQRLYCSQKRVTVKEERPFCIPITTITVQNPQKVPCSLMSDSFEATMKS